VGAVALLLALLPLPAPAGFPPASLIVPSRGIGFFLLGMTEAEVTVQRRHSPCGVRADFLAGRVSRLETNCGGAYQTEESVQVGGGPGRMLAIFGTPDRRTNSDFAGVRGEWLSYTREGIAFRVVYAETLVGGLIQAIAVFQGTAPSGPRRPPAVPPAPAAPPGLGE
jgi:hypothetical protein